MVSKFDIGRIYNRIFLGSVLLPLISSQLDSGVPNYLFRRVCLVKASVNGKEVLRVTVEGINNNSETAAKWGANIQMCNINFMDTEITKKQSVSIL